MKVPVVVSSREDVAGTSITRRLLGMRSWTTEQRGTGPDRPALARDDATGAWLLTIDEPLVHATGLDEACDAAGIEPACYLFASRHRSAAGQPALLAHVTGNWGPDADLGGDPGQVCVASGALLKLAFTSLVRRKERSGQDAGLDAFVVGIEVTHHGPTCLRHPLVFIELGSDETMWTHEGGSQAVAGAILDSVDALAAAGHDIHGLARATGIEGTGIGFGGPHYAATFERVMLSAPVSFSHLVPKHAIGQLTRDAIGQAIRNTAEGVAWFVLDWKGLNKDQKDHLLPLLASFDVPVRRTRDLERW